MSLKESADYLFVFPDPAGRNGEPDPAVWSKRDNLTPQPFAGVGLGISDPDNASSLIYFHATPFLTSNASSPDFKNTATFRGRVQVPAVPDNSTAWVNNALGWRLILDDGSRRGELALARDPGTKARQVRLEGSTAAPIPFPWDNAEANVYEISRLSSGDFVVTLTNADPAATNPIASVTVPAAQLPPTSGTAQFAWGMEETGGGSSFWQSTHGEVNSAEVNFASFLPTQVQVRTRDVNDKIKVSGNFSPASGVTLDPTTQPVTLTLKRGTDTTPFWPQAGVMPVNGFTFNGTDTYSISAAEKTRTGINAFDIKKGWTFNCVDTDALLAVADYTQVLVEFRIGTNVGLALVRLVENPIGSGNWQLG